MSWDCHEPLRDEEFIYWTSKLYCPLINLTVTFASLLYTPSPVGLFKTCLKVSVVLCPNVWNYFFRSDWYFDCVLLLLSPLMHVMLSPSQIYDVIFIFMLITGLKKRACSDLKNFLPEHFTWKVKFS